METILNIFFCQFITLKRFFTNDKIGKFLFSKILENQNTYLATVIYVYMQTSMMVVKAAVQVLIYCIPDSKVCIRHH